jgi:hypothetical protein
VARGVNNVEKDEGGCDGMRAQVMACRTDCFPIPASANSGEQTRPNPTSVNKSL